MDDAPKILPVSAVRWSFSSLKQFMNCPYQYQQVKLLKRYETKVSPQMQFGTDVHKALEEYVRDKSELPKSYKHFQSVVDALCEIPGKRYIEFKMALDAHKKPCDFDSPDYWVRGIVDLMIIDSDTAFVVDYKTGSNKYPDTKQLALMALMTFRHFPEVRVVKGGLLFVVHNTFIKEDYFRGSADYYWDKYFAASLARMEHSVAENWWPMNPSGLCGWCPVQECEHHRSR